MRQALPSLRFSAIAALMLALDWGTKWFANALLVPGRPRPILSSVVRFTLSYDSRTSLWLGVPGTPHWQQPTGLVGLSLLRLVLVLGILWLASRAPRRSWGYAVALGFLLAAAIGNGVERIVYGTVVNFLDFGIGAHRWPAFNVADALTLTGCIVFVALVTREHIMEHGWRGARSLSWSLSYYLPKSFRR